MGGEGVRDGRTFELPEPGLPGVDEDVGDGATLARLDVVVGVAEVDAPSGSDASTDRRLAGSHRTDEDEPRWGHSASLGTTMWVLIGT